MPETLRVLPLVRDSWSHLYVQHCRIDRHLRAVALWDEEGMVPIPCAALMVLMLGPGVTITHAAIATLAEHGCLVLWTGELGVRMYALGMGETHSSRRLQHQATLWADAQRRLEVVRRMYEFRFGERLSPGLGLPQLRGMEGVRVREGYRRASEEWGVPWHGRQYDRRHWKSADPLNRALSAANACLYGVCHAAIVAVGYSPALGFIHTGKMTSFIYDVADLYKVETSIPAAFAAAAEDTEEVEAAARRHSRDAFYETRLLQTVVADLDRILGYQERESSAGDPSTPGDIWDPASGAIGGGVNYADA